MDIGSDVAFRLVVLSVLSLAAFVAGIGYRVLGKVILLSLAIALGVGVVAGFVSLLAFGLFLTAQHHAPYAEGLGVAVIVAGVFAGIVAAVIAFTISLYKLGRRQPQPITTREAVAPVYLVLSGLGVFLIGATSLAHVPTMLSEKTLVQQAVHSRYEHGSPAEQELRRRGQAAVPAIIAALEEIPEAQLRGGPSKESPLALRLLTMLDEFGGAEATPELRRWLHRDVTPALRARAALGLAAVHDRESADAIAQLLALRGKEWRQFHHLLIAALGDLQAQDQVPAIRAALEIEPEIAGSAIEIALLSAGIPTLARFGTADAWAGVVELSAQREHARRRTVLSFLRGIETKAVQQLLLSALDDPDPDIRQTACDSLLGMPTLGQRLSYASCANPRDSEWNAKVQAIRSALNAPSPAAGP